MLTMMRRKRSPSRLPDDHYWDWKKRAAQMARTNMQTCGIKPWIMMIQLHQWGWSGHVARRTDDLSKVIANWQPVSKGRPGRLRTSWMWNLPIEEHLRDHGGRWQAATANRDGWKRKGHDWVATEHEKRRVKRRGQGQYQT